MANRFQAKGGEIIYHAEVSALTEHAAGVVIRTSQGREIETATLIGCAGLMADRLVKMLGVEPVLLSALSAASTFVWPRGTTGSLTI